MKLFLLSKENIKLAKAELSALIGPVKKYSDNWAFAEAKDIEELSNRLAYTKAIYDILFITRKDKLKENIKAFDWNSIYKKDFCVRAHGFDEKGLAGLIWDNLKNPKVNLTSPKTQFEFHNTKDKIYASLLLAQNQHRFKDRKAHKRPESHPTALDPKLARALVNLTGASLKDTICDPFCGAGGILIEAGLMGLKTVGYDLYLSMLDKAKKNLDHFKIKNYKLIKKDATKLSRKFDYIVTDVPYGLNTSIWTKEK
ncbi:MAG: methyltransferase domain-containing protein, partial [Nanoarchaeota archaeon]|nr:methyltransferase domain-containing protein [Nanoarchaeota archaeon]